MAVHHTVHKRFFISHLHPQSVVIGCLTICPWWTNWKTFRGSSFWKLKNNFYFYFILLWQHHNMTYYLHYSTLGLRIQIWNIIRKKWKGGKFQASHFISNGRRKLQPWKFFFTSSPCALLFHLALWLPCWEFQFHFNSLILNKLTPKCSNCIFWQHSDFGQLTMNGVFILFLWCIHTTCVQGVALRPNNFHNFW